MNRLKAINYFREKLQEVIHSFNTYAKFSEKVIFLTLWIAHVRVPIRG